MNYNIFASNIQWLRASKEWSQEDLARFTNVSRQAVSKWENGVSLPDIESLLDLSKLFSLSINDLIEKPVCAGIKAFEEVLWVNFEVLSNVVKEMCLEEVVIAAKGASPQVSDRLNKILPELSLEEEKRKIGPIRLTEVERIHQQMIQAINQRLIEENDTNGGKGIEKL